MTKELDTLSAAPPDLPVVPIRRSCFGCDDGQITGTSSRVFCPHEGRFAIVTKRWAEDAVDAAAQGRMRIVADGEVVAS